MQPWHATGGATIRAKGHEKKTNSEGNHSRKMLVKQIHTIN